MTQNGTNSAASSGSCVCAKTLSLIHVWSSTAVATRGGGSGASTGAVRISLGCVISASPVLPSSAVAGNPVSSEVSVGVGTLPLSRRNLSIMDDIDEGLGFGVGLGAGDSETWGMNGSKHSPTSNSE